MNDNRVEKVLQQMKEQKVSQLLICDAYSIFYLTGVYIEPWERFYALYLNENGKHKFFVNHLFLIPKNLGVELIWYSDTDAIMDIVAGLTDHTAVLGVDKYLQARFLLPLQEKKAATGFVNASICVDLTRGCKDSEEQEKMKAVSKINDLAMEEIKKRIVPGITEKELAGQLPDIYKGFGADGYSFEPLVSFGANGAEGHHAPDDTILKEGDCVLIDMGCKKDGYCADMTRTFFFRSVTEEHKKVYNLVQQANEAAIAQLKPGRQLKEIDQIARDVITKAGYGPNFTHRLGHFIGLEVHEYGDVSATNETIIKPGMIFSIEPGIYLDGELGVRIEDLVLVTETGCERLNHYNKALEIVE